MYTDQSRPDLYRTAGLAAFAAAAAHGLNLALQTAVAMIAPPPEFTLPAEAAGHVGFAAVTAVGSLLWGLGIAVAVIALTRLTGRVGVLAELFRATGLIGAGGLMLGGGAVLAQYGAAAGGIAEAGGDEAVQRAIFASTFVLNTAAPFLTVLALGGWLLWLAVVGRRAGVFGVALAGVVAVVAVAQFGVSVVTGFPVGLLLISLLMLALGVVWRGRSRSDAVLSGTAQAG